MPLLRFLLATLLTAFATEACAFSAGGNYAGWRQTTAAPYTQAGATFQVPSMTYGHNKRNEQIPTEWVGIEDGAGHLIQAGYVCQMLHQVVAGQTPPGALSCQAFYELLPASVILLDEVINRVKPLDIFTTNIVCASNCGRAATGQTWTITLNDYSCPPTTGADSVDLTRCTSNWPSPFSKTVSFSLNQVEAEIILEAGLSRECKHYRCSMVNFGSAPVTGVLFNNANPNFPQHTINLYAGFAGDFWYTCAPVNGDSFDFIYAGPKPVFPACLSKLQFGSVPANSPP